MGIFRNFPYTNFHELNLDEILKTVSYLQDEWENFAGNWEEEVAKNVDEWLNSHPEATTTVQDGTISLVKLTDNLKNLTLKDCLIPDMFEGSDTVKLQACLDELRNTGGIILINRIYDINANLINHLNTDATHKKIINIIGIGKTPVIKLNEYSFISDNTNPAIGGLHFSNIDFEGSENCFKTKNLIRLFFHNCRFYNFRYVIYGESVTQSIYFSQCYFERISRCVFYNATDGVWNIGFNQCICENGGGFYEGDPLYESNGNYNIVIRDCCIETMDNSCIIPSSNTLNFIMTGCYFEAAQPVDLSRCGGAYVKGMCIENNLFFLADSVPAIIMPTSNAGDGIRGKIAFNICSPDTSILAKSDANIVGLIRYQFDNNTGVIDVPSRYVTFQPLYGEVRTFTLDQHNMEADGAVMIDNSTDYGNALAISLIYQATSGNYYNPGCCVCVHPGGSLWFHNGPAFQAIAQATVKVIMPTN